MLRLIILAIVQSTLLAFGQVFLKIALQRMEPFAWSAHFFKSALTNWTFALSGLSFASASILWMYMIKHFPLSVAYPLGSLSYAICLVTAVIFFHETVDYTKWIGVFLIMAGCAIIAR
ncbi:MAG: EamA family transporter [Prevotella sp.]|nr:EamA family transporter [Candidatus Prevotella equi]